MNTVKAFIEIGKDGTYSVYVDLEDNTLNYGIYGTGDTVKDAVEDFESAYEAMKEFYHQKEKEFVEASFEYHYDMASFLQYYSNFFSLAGLSRMTGIHQGQLSHYVTGHRTPSRRTIEKIDSSIHHFATKLSQVRFV
ncbi:MAG: type II toxin-antitoxin system HicB family antitoxin [Candidatus Azobacteroides sp.]|nr:type II toxin-antitoxin system HicB family antitoxin [Candidatus Azobacteroides sp.]